MPFFVIQLTKTNCDSLLHTFLLVWCPPTDWSVSLVIGQSSYFDWFNLFYKTQLLTILNGNI